MKYEPAKRIWDDPEEVGSLLIQNSLTQLVAKVYEKHREPISHQYQNQKHYHNYYYPADDHEGSQQQ
jgi:hypothetical protein